MPLQYAEQPYYRSQRRQCHGGVISISRELKPFTLTAKAVFILLYAFCASLALTLIAGATAWGQDAVDADIPIEAENAVLQALDKKIDFDFEYKCLEDAAKDLSQRSGIQIGIDAHSLEDIGLDGTAEVSLRARALSLRAGLRHLLRYLDLTWTVRDGSIQITTPETAEIQREGRFFNVRDLVCTDGGPGTLEMDTLIQLLKATVTPDCWDDVGGPYSLNPYHELLIAHCSPDVHHEIEGALVGVRELKRRFAARADAVGTDAVSLPTKATHEAIRETLGKKIVKMSFAETPLDEAADELSELSGVPVLIDHRALEEVGLFDSPTVELPAETNPFGDGADPFGGDPGEDDPFGGEPGEVDPFGGSPSEDNPLGGGPGEADPFGGDPDDADPFGGAPGEDDPFGGESGEADPFGDVAAKQTLYLCSMGNTPLVSFEASNITLRVALNRMLRPLELDWMIRDEVIVITTPEQCECFLSTRVYPVRDLVVDQDGLSSPDEYELLIEVISDCAGPDTWDVVGGPGAIEPLRGMSALVVSQTEEVHEKVCKVLARLRRERAKQPADEPAAHGPEGATDDGMILRIYYLEESTKPLDTSRVDDLLTIVRGLAEPGSSGEVPTSYVHKYGNAIIINHRVGVHREFVELLTKLGVDWRTTLDRVIIPSLLPVVGENGTSQGGFFDVETDG